MIVLDTHAVLWLAADPSRLSDEATAAIQVEAEPTLSAISVQEIAYLATRGRIDLDRPIGAWIANVRSAHELSVLPLTAAIAMRAGSLDPETFPGDPADRAIYATAVQQGVRLLTADRRLRDFDPTRCIW